MQLSLHIYTRVLYAVIFISQFVIKESPRLMQLGSKQTMLSSTTGRLKCLQKQSQIHRKSVFTVDQLLHETPGQINGNCHSNMATKYQQ